MPTRDLFALANFPVFFVIVLRGNVCYTVDCTAMWPVFERTFNIAGRYRYS